MHDYLIAIILGVVEGLTEFLPISSTGHLILAEKLLGVEGPVWQVFEIMIQLGAILAVVVLYFGKFWSTLTGLFGDPRARYFALLLIVALLPSLVLGYLFSGIIKSYLFTPFVVGITLIVGGLVILLVENTHRQDIHHEADELPLTTGGLIGLAQAVAMIPGTSRSAATIVGARLLGVDRRAATEFSFFLSVPTMVAAFGHEAVKYRHDITGSAFGLIAVGFIAAFISAYLIVKPFLEFVSTRGFQPFAYYRIALGAFVLALSLL
jgi:undecaprenyl-diphosphatase